MAINRTENGIEFTDHDLIEVKSILAGWKAYVEDVKGDTPASFYPALDEWINFVDRVDTTINGDSNG